MGISKINIKKVKEEEHEQLKGDPEFIELVQKLKQANYAIMDASSNIEIYLKNKFNDVEDVEIIP